MSLFDYRYYAYPNGDIIIVRNVAHDNNHLLGDFDRKKSRNFQLNYHKYRIISSAAIELLKMAENAVIFLTFEVNLKLGLTEVQTNCIWNKFIKNFKKTYGCKNYVGVLELQESGNPHYHFLADYPFADIVAIDKSWKLAIANYLADNSINHCNCVCGSVQLPKDFPSVVADPARTVNYICKYFSKSRGKYRSKCYFISRGLRRKIAPRELTSDEFDLLNSSITPVKSKQFEHCRVNCYNYEILAQLLDSI